MKIFSKYYCRNILVAKCNASENNFFPPKNNSELVSSSSKSQLPEERPAVTDVLMNQ